MNTKWRIVTALTVVGAGALQAGESLQSGPPVGSLLPGSFQPFNLNGKTGKNRYHCLVCEYGLKPTVMVFAREQPEGKNAGLDDLLQKLEEAVERHKEAYLHAFVVFLSPDARTSVTDPSTDDPAKLVDEAAAWESLLGRMRPRAEKLKNVVLAVYPAEGPPGYKLAKEADVTVVLYRKHRVVAGFAFAKGKLDEEGVGQVMKKVHTMAAEMKKKPVAAPKKT
jgi:hypothetical protein